MFRHPSIQWVTATLRSAEAKNLRTISLVLPYFTTLSSESVYHGWFDLDFLLVQLWASHSLRLKLRLSPGDCESKDVEEKAAKFLPESIGMGIVDIELFSLDSKTDEVGISAGRSSLPQYTYALRGGRVESIL